MVNDTVGTMMTCAYEEPSCEVGLIVGGCPGNVSSRGEGWLCCFVGPGHSSAVLGCGTVHLSVLSLASQH